jgi:7,8-dihydropterin-6-yl-methyl-4-(beta-D-ribofuranosyl)aminobenzene 5'-phosphate synthase
MTMRTKLLAGIGMIVLIAVLLTGVLVVWAAHAGAADEQEWQATRVEKVQNLGTTHLLEILPLFEEAKASDDVELEHGVSYLVKTDHQNILMDLGTTPARLRHNMQALHVGENEFDAVLITHLHPDHIGGTNAWWTSTLVPGDPPLDLKGKPIYVPMPVSNADSVVVSRPMKIAEGVATIGTIPFVELFPLSLKSGRNAEQVLAVNVQGKGIVLITGCGHPTVERIGKLAQAALDAPIVGIVGGLHYEGLSREQAQPHIAFIHALDPLLVALSPHDSIADAIQAFRDAFSGVYQEIRIGETVRLAAE